MGSAGQVDSELVQHLLSFWDRRGIEVEPLCQYLGIQPGVILPRWFCTTAVAELLQRVTQLAEDPLLPLKTGVHLAGCDLPLVRLLSLGSSLSISLPLALQACAMSSGSAKYHIETAPAQINIHVQSMGVGSEEHSAASLMALALLLSVCRLQTGAMSHHDYALSVVTEDILTTQHINDYLDVPVQRAAYWCLSIRMPAWLYTHDDRSVAAFDLAWRQWQRHHKKMTQYERLQAELQHVIEQGLLHRQLSQEWVAAELGINIRNLQRRLKALGTTYQTLLDRARRDMALNLIEQTELSLADISFAVGYNEPSAFYKAFKRWTEQTPGDYRQRLFSAASVAAE